MNWNACFLLYWHAVNVHVKPEPSAGLEMVILAFRESCPWWPVDPPLYPPAQSELT